VLYECVTGHQPFKGKTSGVILSEILNRVPPSPLVLNPELPVRLQEIITNCLEKDRELRYPDAAALRTDLKRLKRDLESGPRSVSQTAIPIEMPRRTVAAPTRIKYGWVVATVAVVSTLAAFYVFRGSSRQPAADVPASVAQDTVTPPDDRTLSAPTPVPTPLPQEPATVPPPVATPRAAAPAPERRQEPARIAPVPPSLPPPLVAETLPSPAPSPVLPPSAPLVPATQAPTAAPAPAPAATVQAAPVQAAPAPATDDDDTVIRRVIASYARAIESKDINAFRAVKPNLSGAEQRRLQDSFDAVASQKVDITVQSIEHRASSALVKVRRRDTLTAGGRAQTSDSQQTMTLIRSGAGWVISEIGR